MELGMEMPLAVTAVLLLLSMAGYMLLARRMLALQWEFVPVFTFSSIACLVFLGGLVGMLYPVSLGVLLGGDLSLLVMALLWLRRRARPRLSLSIFQLGFFAGSLFFLQMLLRNRLTHYDNFSHWAIVLKLLLSTDAFPTPDAALIDFKNYPLGVTSFLYYICRFAGHSQSIMLVAQGLLIFSCFYAMFGIIADKQRFLLYAFLAFGLSTLSFFNITIRITNLLVDFLLPIYALAALAAVYRYRESPKRACLVVLPLAGLLTVVKSTGILFAAVALLFLVYMAFVYRRGSSWSDGFLLPIALCASFLPYIGWSRRMATVFEGVENKFEVSSSGLQGAATGKTPEQMKDIISLFLHSSTDLATRPALGIAAFEVAAIVASLFAAIVLKRKWKLWKAMLALNAVVLLYYAGILALYLYSMPLDEAIQLAGFERYASSIVVLFAGGLTLCAAVDLERSFYYKIGEMPSARAFKSVATKGYYQKGIWVCTSVAAIVLLSEYNGIQSIAAGYDGTLPNKVAAVTGDRWYEGGQADSHRYLFYASDTDQQVTNYYLQYIGKYFLYAPNVDGIVLFYEDNMDNLLSGYDYLVVVESDSDGDRLLRKHYGVQMEAGIYQITRSGEQIGLKLVN
ncbi:hypothetical protein [Cohnella fermenti]|uniref:Glycosyltransferase RgtA/B/C/D-like domain-containing protein n=1 Tax=Cohnella fermenti TaxID=2565925 RepID=A0A4S4BHX6_9BACL|nr:hypothetical protein [Cohnella fermenti]THF74052.1 hypothetical protein E6C55_26545 [Cohnella fermenti]